MKGVRVYEDVSFRELTALVEQEVEKLFWLISSQSGPFDVIAQPDWRTLGQEVDRYVVDIPETEDTSEILVKPGALPRFAHLLVRDEWMYFIGISGTPTAAAAKAAALLRPTVSVSWPFVDAAEQHVQVIIVYPERGRWEIYSASPGWFALPNGWSAEPIDSSERY